MSNLSESNDSQIQLIDLMSEKFKEDINDINFIAKLIASKNDKISYSIKKGKSDAWKSYQSVFFDNKETSFVKCNDCNKIFKYNSSIGIHIMYLLYKII
jgi:hypothetical protein